MKIVEGEQIVIVKLGAEGGSLELRGLRSPKHGWNFTAFRNETAVVSVLSSEDSIGIEPTSESPLSSWEEAIAILDRYPWTELYPMELHPEFRDRILREVEIRGGEAAIDHWIAVLDRHQSAENSRISRGK